jgi:hypothetical protein
MTTSCYRYTVWRRVGYQERQSDLWPAFGMAKPAAPRNFWCKRARGRCEPFGLMDATRALARRAIPQIVGS